MIAKELKITQAQTASLLASSTFQQIITRHF